MPAKGAHACERNRNAVSIPAGIPALLIVVALLSNAVLAFEVELTRLFAVVLHYHFAFLSISIALCGLGLGGYAGHIIARPTQCKDVTSNSHRDSPQQFMTAITIALYGVAIGICIVTVLLLRVVLPLGTQLQGVNGVIITITISGLTTMLPFIFAGIALSLLFRQYAHIGGALYAADLAGAAAGSIVAVLLLNWLGGINATFVTAAISALAPMFLHLLNSDAVPEIPNAIAQRQRNRWLYCSISCIIAIAGISATVVNVTTGSRLLDVPKLKRRHGIVIKPLWVDLADPLQKEHIVWTVWDAFGRTDVVASAIEPSVMYIYTDGHNPSLMIKFDGDLSKMDEWRRFIGFVPFALRPPRRVLCLGAGGGLDVLLALLGGARDIDAVDVNPALPKVMDKFKQFHGGIYGMRGVRLIIREGRAFIKQSRKRYDLIFSALTQTATTGGLGISLVESYIHTLEACTDYYRSLSPNGLLALIVQEPLLTVRWWLTVVKTLHRETGKSEPACTRHTAILSLPKELMPFMPYRYLVLMSKRPFSSAECQRLAKLAEDMQLQSIFIPSIVEQDPFDLVSRYRLPSNRIIHRFAANGRNVAPATDDAPFFLDLNVGIPITLHVLLAFTLILLVAFAITATLIERRSMHGDAHSMRNALLATLYFGALGIGYILIEIALLQRFSLPASTPTFAVALLLFTLLIGSAIGSAITQRIEGERQLLCSVVIMSLLIGAISMLWFVSTHATINWLLQYPLAIRAILLGALLILTGVPMGMPFPSGIRFLGKHAPTLVPYAWGVNGILSVTGSIVAVMIGKLYGYRVALVAGGLIYIALALCMLTLWAVLRFARRTR